MRLLEYIPLLAVAVALVPAMAAAVPDPRQQAEPPAQGKKSQDPKKTSRNGSLTGCVDQQEGHYVLLGDRDLNRIAVLEAVGFPDEGFAKHVGQKVTVRGTPIAGSEPARFQVRAIQTVSDRCTPQDSQQTKQ